MIVYKGKDEDYDVSFWFYDQNIRVDWGDGIIEDFVNEQARQDRKEGILRNKSGMIISSPSEDTIDSSNINVIKTLDNNQNLDQSF